MIKIDFEEPADPQWVHWRERCSEEQGCVIEAIGRGETPEINDLYKEQSGVYRSLSGAFHGKCSYCESLVQVNQPGDLDHFRPKNRVTDIDGSVVQVTRPDGIQVPHPGYRWLAYDSTNLLPSCIDCNRPSRARTAGIAIGKADRFPVRGFRATGPGQEDAEEPLLINPVVEDPEEHIAIDQTGILIPKSERGRICIEVFGLNLREALVESRRNTYRETRNKMIQFVQALHLNHTPDVIERTEELRTIKAGHRPHGIAGRAAIAEDKQLILLGLRNV